MAGELRNDANERMCCPLLAPYLILGDHGFEWHSKASRLKWSILEKGWFWRKMPTYTGMVEGQKDCIRKRF